MSVFTDFIKTKIQSALETFFDNSTNGFVSNDVQSAIEEVKDSVVTSASPGFSFGRSGNIPSKTWLLRPGSVPSNKTGIPLAMTTPVVTLVACGNENIATFTVEIYEHEGDEVNLTLLGSVNVVSARTGTFNVNFPATSGRQLAVYLSAGSAKNLGVDLQLSGST